MKICIVGAGAVGGFIGARLAATEGLEVSALARGATLEALRTHGWRLHLSDTLIQRPARCSEHAADLGEQDLVIIAVKGPALAAVAASLRPLLGPSTSVLPAMNGVPWWFCTGREGFDAPLASVDPGGTISHAIPLECVIGCVVHASTIAPAPGVVVHKGGNGLIIGEAKGGRSERVTRIGQVLLNAGFDVTMSEDVRQAIWYKLWGNLTMNPMSAVTGATVDQLLSDDLVLGFCSAAMREAAVIGERIGCFVGQTPEERHQVTARLGAFKTSMLQDVEAGRPIELDSIVSAVREIGVALHLPTPNIDGMLGIARLFGRVRGLYS